jgi:replication factor C small subunit
MSQKLFDLWEYKHSPKKIEDMALDPTVRIKLQRALKELPNMMLYGAPGTGKGTFANILINETGFDHMWINASDETGIDTIRDKVKTFSTALGMTEMKIVVLNESDSLSMGAQGAQKMLKQLIEDVQKICRFVFLTNDLSQMTDAIISRCKVMVDMSQPSLKEIGVYASKVLKKEGVKYDNKILISIIKQCYPDIRRTISTLQDNTIDGELKSDDILSNQNLFKTILQMIVKQDLDGLRNALRSNYIHYVNLYEFLYENVGAFRSPGGAILSIGDHLRWHKEHANKEINFMHMVMQMMWEKIV